MSDEHNRTEPPRPIGGAAPIKAFESGHIRAVWTIGSLAVVAAMEAAVAGLNVRLYISVMAGLDGRLDTGGGITDWAADAMVVCSIIAFSLWTHRVYRNLPALGARSLRYTPGWAVGWLFIPFANLVVPYFVFAEIWGNSIPVPADSATDRSKRRSPLLIGWWIVNVLPFVVLVVGLVGLVAAIVSAARGANNPGKFAQSISEPLLAWFVLAAVVVPLIGSAAAILAIFVVRRIDKDQRAKFELTAER